MLLSEHMLYLCFIIQNKEQKRTSNTRDQTRFSWNRLSNRKKCVCHWLLLSKNALHIFFSDFSGDIGEWLPNGTLKLIDRKKQIFKVRTENCSGREYTSGSLAKFNSWLWSQNKRKVDVDFQAAREEQNWYSELPERIGRYTGCDR